MLDAITQIGVVALEVVPFVALGGKMDLAPGQPVTVPSLEKLDPMGAMRDDILDRGVVLILRQRGVIRNGRDQLVQLGEFAFRQPEQLFL